MGAPTTSEVLGRLARDGGEIVWVLGAPHNPNLKIGTVTLHDADGGSVAFLAREELEQLLRQSYIAEHGTMDDEFRRRYRITAGGRAAAERLTSSPN